MISTFDDAPTLENEWIHHSDLDSGLRFLEAIPKLFKILKQNSIDPYIQIKQKRRRINSHFDSYLETLNNLYEADYAVELHWSFDLAKCVLESDFVICAIATSPALLARYFGVPVAYYFGGIHTLGKPPIDYGIPIFFSPLELSKWILTKL